MAEETEKVSLEQNDLFLKNVYRHALLPCILSILSSNVNILFDGILVGQKIGVGGLAGLNLCMPVYLVLCVIGSFFVSGTAIPASRSIGKNQIEKAQEYYQLAIGTTLISSVVITAVGLVLLEPITQLLCSDPSLHDIVRVYSGVTIAGALPKIMLYIPFWFLRLDGRNSQSTILMMVIAGGNVALDFLFMYGFSLGVFGAALASVISTTAATAIGFIYLCDRRSSFHFGIRWKAAPSRWNEIVRCGSPSSLNNLAQTFRILCINSLLMAFGGRNDVALFAAVNCMSEFSLSILSGVPQAASAMLGIFTGEMDNNSIRILMKKQKNSGLLGCALFGGLITVCSGLIRSMYGLQSSLLLPMACLALSLFPALFNTVMISYYNIAGKNLWANLLIACRVFVFAVGSLWILEKIGVTPWWFMLAGETMTIGVWALITGRYHRTAPNQSRTLLLDDTREKERKVLTFSTKGTNEAICEASQRISSFCEENGMGMKEVMRLELSMEEIMTLITTANPNIRMEFDLRAFSLQGVKGIRIRYGGREYNPFDIHNEGWDQDEYMGARLVKTMVEDVIYQRNFGTNTIIILI